MLIKCKCCGKEFETTRKTAVYCSLECRNQNITLKQEYTCDYCGAKVMRKPSDIKGKKHIFCSQKCHSDFAWETIICQNCGRSFTAKKSLKRKFCSQKCSQDYVPKHQPTNREKNYL